MRWFELLIGLRYTRAKRRNHFISFISLLSLLGIMLGMTALITVLSVMNGFQKEVRNRMLSVASHVQIGAQGGALREWPEVLRMAAQHPEVQAGAAFVNAQALLSLNGEVRGVMLRGVDPQEENKVAEFADKMKLGRLEDLRAGEFGILLGKEIALALGANLGDKVVVIAPQGLVTPAGIVPRLRQFTVKGIFEVGHYEFDSGLAVIHLSDAQKLYRMGEAVSGVRLKLKDLFEAPRVASELLNNIPPDAYITDWTRQNSTYFRAVQIEKRMMWVILTLIVAVAAFNIVSTLVMVVQDKQADIAILRTLGASPSSIMRIFIIQGMTIGVVGTVLGLIGGILLALNVGSVVGGVEKLFGVRILDPAVYYISDFPSDLQTPDVVTVAAVAFALTLLATLYPSYRASRVNPAEALRYE